MCQPRRAVFALILFTYLPESQIYKKFLFIQTNSFIIFTCLNPVLLFWASGKWASTKTGIAQLNLVGLCFKWQAEIYENDEPFSINLCYDCITVVIITLSRSNSQVSYAGFIVFHELWPLIRFLYSAVMKTDDTCLLPKELFFYF